MRLYRGSLSLAAVCAAALMLVPVRAQQELPAQASDQARFHRQQNKIANNYIVVLDQDAVGPGADEAAADDEVNAVLATTATGKLKHVYAHALVGFAAEMSEEDAVALSRDPRVRFVEEDSTMEIVTTQTNATWGIDRIDQRTLPLNADLHLHRHRQRRERLHHRHRHPHHAHAVRRARVGGVRRGRRWPQRPGLQRPRHARVGHRRRIDVWRRQGRPALRGARAQLLRDRARTRA